ncbi:uncharacterized protein LOC117802806 [Ailuropoda melanoleuca]|uniref:uncharacterized protein LOC117802806 n=1 Tax=Ailuropoda melanoleuca TaxID=9646 RepID=UPI001494F83A|nr:uncharacterized protein LOC117802806 [Ailuropoda melanoleuca]
MGAAGGGLREARGGLRAARSPGELKHLCRLPIKWEPEVIGGSRGCDASRAAAAAAAARTLSAGFNGQLLLHRPPPACPLPRFRSEDEEGAYEKQIEGVTRRSNGGSLDNGRTINSRGAQGTHTPNILSRSVIEISRGAAARNRRDFSAVCSVCIRINSALRHPAGNSSRFECTKTHRPSTGWEVAAGDPEACRSGLRRRLDYQRPQAGSGSLLPHSARQPPPLVVLRKPAGPSTPGAKTESKFRGK